MGDRMVETIKYETIRKIGKIEIRRYPKIVIAKVTDSTDAFDLLYWSDSKIALSEINDTPFLIQK
jgi:hypothetical protein